MSARDDAETGAMNTRCGVSQELDASTREAVKGWVWVDWNGRDGKERCGNNARVAKKERAGEARQAKRGLCYGKREGTGWQREGVVVV